MGRDFWQRATVRGEAELFGVGSLDVGRVVDVTLSSDALGLGVGRAEP